MSLKRKHAEDAPDEDVDVFRSSPIEDRASRFIGLFSPSVKPKELQARVEIASASHKILGWRRESNQQSITKAKQYVTGSDDDGEKYGGKRIEKVLETMQAEGSCVVARWYGGNLLGPVRFNHIETVAREAVEQWRQHEMEGQAKKRKLEEDEAEHANLSKALVERDQSIVVLRALAIEKEKRLEQESEGNEQAIDNAAPTAPPSSSAAPVMDYSAMPLERLRALDRARDATLSFLLKRINKAEAELASPRSQSTDKPP